MKKSYIKSKVGICPECTDNKPKILISGLCAGFHYKLHRKKICDKRKKERLQKNNNLEKDLQDSISLDLWFKERRHEMNGVCCNCGNPSSKFSDTHYKFSIAHILAKAIFKSVMTHKLNWIELCMVCHTKFDRNLMTAMTMRCWIFAVRKLRQFIDEVTEKNKLITTIKEYLLSHEPK